MENLSKISIIYPPKQKIEFQKNKKYKRLLTQLNALKEHLKKVNDSNNDNKLNYLHKINVNNIILIFDECNTNCYDILKNIYNYFLCENEFNCLLQIMKRLVILITKEIPFCNDNSDPKNNYDIMLDKSEKILLKIKSKEINDNYTEKEKKNDINLHYFVHNYSKSELILSTLFKNSLVFKIFYKEIYDFILNFGEHMLYIYEVYITELEIKKKNTELVNDILDNIKNFK